MESEERSEIKKMLLRIRILEREVEQLQETVFTLNKLFQLKEILGANGESLLPND